MNSLVPVFGIELVWVVSDAKNVCTGSESFDISLGRTYGWGDHVQIEPKLTLSDVLNDSRDLSLSIHLNLVF